ncbi:MAG TPA: 50S ribosomal protein L29 [Persephonella sp.]|uniref:Large ribosomal subunit protein uL29 n=1 Tax=Persephonella marina (strain DSM 14350 / EX-H1) TaxID=123214 RepID=RL29_PERMH|nr:MULTISPECIES: 50S ribosomal protein L29 [Persephonella]C0QQN1.1 RecName: Full=Large ribosomal subunit protein uL29; AltName: Full=50S ribosomal protein L29 [Persephonella marina EX-H1]ACO04200.1 ribosomal protein L29 [Persephonella marina EX-H1]HCB68728.1 50S ribosomal protein L29 [Persephonella sp.]
MKAEELRKLTDDELKDKLTELKKKLMNLRFQNAVGGLEKPSEIKATKRDIARILTILRERELSKAGGE